MRRRNSWALRGPQTPRLSPNCPSSLRKRVAHRHDLEWLRRRGAVECGKLSHRLDLIRRRDDVVAIEDRTSLWPVMDMGTCSEAPALTRFRTQLRGAGREAVFRAQRLSCRPFTSLVLTWLLESEEFEVPELKASGSHPVCHQTPRLPRGIDVTTVSRRERS